MSHQQNTLSKLCACGRGTLMTGDKSKYNARNSAGVQVCTDCLMDEIRSSIKNG